MTLPEAIEALRAGHLIRRRAWSPFVVVRMHPRTKHAIIELFDGREGPWIVASDDDREATDYEIAEESRPS
jgi:hypothetical protein